MKSIYSTLCLVALFLSGYSGFSQTETEPNNTTGTANALAQGANISGNVGPGDADDYFVGIPNSEGTVTFTVNYTNTSGNAGADLYIYMYNANSGQIGTSNALNVGVGTSSSINITVPCRKAETIYFRITSGFAFSYSANFNTVTTGTNDAEPNNSFPQATYFNSNSSVDGHVGYLGVTLDNNDYYATVLPDDGTLKVYLNYTNTSGGSTVDLYYYAYNEGQGQIGSRSLINRPVGLSTTDTMTIYCREADTVYFLVSANECISYNLSYEVISPSHPDDTEPNNSFAQATFFTQGNSVDGRIGYISTSQDIYDYYATALPDDGTLKVYLNYTNNTGGSTVDLYYYAYNEGQGQIGSRTLTNRPLGLSTTDTMTIYCREADTVYFMVNATECISYNLSYEVIAPTHADDVEPNNTFAQATFFPSGSSVDGRIGYVSVGQDIYDYYSTVLPDDGTLKVYLNYTNTTGGSTVDLYYYAYNEGQGNIGSRTLTNRPLGFSDTDTMTIYCREADTVYFLINASECISYNLSYEVISPTHADDTEPNNTFAQATFFPSGSSVDGRIGYVNVGQDIYDYYRTVLPDDGTLNVYLNYTNTTGSNTVDLYYYAYNKGQGQIGSRSLTNRPLGFTDTDTLTIYCRKADTVYYLINASECISYNLSYEMTNVAPSDPEPNNNFANATLINLEDTTKGNIGYTSVGTDVYDYYKVYNSGYSEIKWKVNFTNTSNTSGADLYLYAYNSGQGQIGYVPRTNQPIGSGSDSISFTCYPQDTLYLMLLKGDGCFSYSFEFDLVSGTFYADADSDNFGNNDSTIYSCVGPPPGFVSDNSDCDDGNNAINPNAIEICDGVDNNCDGNIDEGIYTTSNTNATICQGDSILIGGQYRFAAGVYTDTTIVINGCDSIANVTVTVNPTHVTGTTTTTNNAALAGIFSNTFLNQYLCDSTHIDTVVYVAPPCPTTDSTTVTMMTCDSTLAGMSSVTLQGSDGCDSVVTTVKIYDPGSTTVLSAAIICDGDSALIFGVSRTNAGVYQNVLTNQNGCDSIIEQELIVNPNYNITIPAMTICSGDSLLIFGTYQNTPGTYSFTYQSIDGCDSTVSKQLFVESQINTNSLLAICDGDSALIFGQYQTAGGAYMNTSQSQSGCDSVHTITLTVKPNVNISANAMICDGDSILLGGAYQTTAGVYTDVYQAGNVCDSIVNTTLSIKPNVAVSAAAMICDGDSILLGGAYQTAAGIYKDTYPASNGCDSVVTTTLSIKPDVTITVKDSICPGDSLYAGGAYQTTAGTYTDVYPSANGCDSTVKTMLSIRTDSGCGGTPNPQACLSVVSDVSWSQSTTISPSNFSGTWNGAPSLPAPGTYTNPVVLGQPYGFASINDIENTQVLSTGNSITYLRKEFNLTNASNLDVRILTTVDDQADIYLNGQRVALITSFGRSNFKFPAHDVKFYSNGAVSNGHLAGDAFDMVTATNLNTILTNGTNELIVAVRNLGKASDKGGLSFRMDINCNDGDITKKSSSVDIENRLVLFPNPVQDLLTISSNLAINEVKIHDLTGKLISSTTHNAEKEVLINMEGVPQGVYMVTVNELGGEVNVMKVVKN